MFSSEKNIKKQIFGIENCQLPCYIGKKGDPMEIKETIVDRFGRIVIPKKIRDDFNLEAGTQIRFEESEQGIVLKPVRGEANLRWKDGVLVFSGISLEDLSNALAKHREKRSRSVLKP